MLIVFSGLPGTGKSSIARELARQMRATYLRTDTIEQALRSCETLPEIMEEGYAVAFRVAEDNLKLGSTVVADAVNAVEVAREAWADVARRANVRLINVEVICSDEVEHKRRVQTRPPDITNLTLPTWEDVKDHEFHAWTQPRVVIDTAGRSVGACVGDLISKLAI